MGFNIGTSENFFRVVATEAVRTGRNEMIVDVGEQFEVTASTDNLLAYFQAAAHRAGCSTASEAVKEHYKSGVEIQTTGDTFGDGTEGTVLVHVPSCRYVRFAVKQLTEDPETYRVFFSLVYPRSDIYEFPEGDMVSLPFDVTECTRTHIKDLAEKVGADLREDRLLVSGKREMKVTFPDLGSDTLFTTGRGLPPTRENV